VCDDGNACTVSDACRAGQCEGTRRLRESFVCDGVDEDCDGVIDEDCRFRVSGGFVDRSGGPAIGDDGSVIAPAGRALGVSGTSSNGTFTLRPRSR
jgi:hypothetical protein